jgi:hypothetical protein
VSIYLPTTPITQEAQASRIELKNLAAAATERMQAAGSARPVVSELRESLDDLVQDDGFWEEQSHSLAVFGSPGGLRTFRLPNRLITELEVSDRFYVKPLLRAITFPQAACVLALAAGSVRLVEIARDGPAFTVKVPDLPSDAASAAGKSSLADRSPDRRIQGSEGQKLRLRQYARKVDHALRGVLTGLELPLILAASDPLDAIYRSLNSYPHLVERASAVIPGTQAMRSSPRRLEPCSTRSMPLSCQRSGTASSSPCRAGSGRVMSQRLRAPPPAVPSTHCWWISTRRCRAGSTRRTEL